MGRIIWIAAAWLVGRGTYAWFAERWAARPGEWADRLRSIPKFIVSSTLEDPAEWTNSTVLKGDVIEEVSKLKQNVDGDIPPAAPSRHWSGPTRAAGRSSA